MNKIYYTLLLLTTPHFILNGSASAQSATYSSQELKDMLKFGKDAKVEKEKLGEIASQLMRRLVEDNMEEAKNPDGMVRIKGPDGGQKPDELSEGSNDIADDGATQARAQVNSKTENESPTPPETSLPSGASCSEQADHQLETCLERVRSNVRDCVGSCGYVGLISCLKQCRREVDDVGRDQCETANGIFIENCEEPTPELSPQEECENGGGVWTGIWNNSEGECVSGLSCSEMREQCNAAERERCEVKEIWCQEDRNKSDYSPGPYESSCSELKEACIYNSQSACERQEFACPSPTPTPTPKPLPPEEDEGKSCTHWSDCGNATYCFVSIRPMRTYPVCNNGKCEGNHGAYGCYSTTQSLGDNCEDDSQCPSGTTCVNNKVGDPSKPGSSNYQVGFCSCSADHHCPTGEVCGFEDVAGHRFCSAPAP